MEMLKLQKILEHFPDRFLALGRREHLSWKQRTIFDGAAQRMRDRAALALAETGSVVHQVPVVAKIKRHDGVASGR